METVKTRTHLKADRHARQRHSQAAVVTRSILSPKTLLKVAEAWYPIGRPAHCRLLACGQSDSYELTTGDGHYVLRVYRARVHSLSEILYELKLLRHLAQKNAPVSMPLRCLDGALTRAIPAPEGVRRMAVFTYAEGRPLVWDNNSHPYLAGRVVGMFHVASDDFTSPHDRRSLDQKHLLDDPVNAIRPYLDHRRNDWKYLCRVVERIRERWTSSAQAGLDWGVCHTDLSGGNIHIAPDGQLTIFDFDGCAPGYRAYDLVAVYWMTRYLKSSQMWDSFIRGYREQRPLSNRDLAAVRLFDGVRRIWGLGMLVRSIAQWGVVRLSDWHLDWDFKELRQWEREYFGHS